MRLTAYALAAVLAVAAGSARADEPTTEQLAKAFIAKNKEVVELLIAIRDEALSVCLMFEQFLFDAVKHHVLTDGAIDAEEAFWLRQRLFANGNLGKREKKLLWDLKHEVLGVSREFQQLYDEYM